jgi:hypothetical protein
LTASCIILPASASAQHEAEAWAQARKAAADEALALLRAANPKDIAWGAFRAAEHRVDGLSPEIAAVLEAPPASNPDERRAMVAALLEAAVQLGLDLPAPLLRRYWQTYPVQTAILFNRTTDRSAEEVLRDLLDRSSGFPWFAVANRLLARKAPGFAAQLLDAVHLTLRVAVSDGGTVSVGSGSGLGAGVSDGIGVNPAGYPPCALYRFEIGPLPGYVVLSTGPRTIYYSRRLEYQWQFGVSETGIGGPDDHERLTYLRAMLTASTGAAAEPIEAERQASIQWRGPDDFTQRIASLRQEFVEQYRRLVSAIAQTRWLTESERQTRWSPAIAVEISDRRSDRSQPIPAIKP